MFEGLRCGDLVGDGADTADTGGDIWDIIGWTAFEEGFEEAWGFIDVELYVLDLIFMESDIQCTFAFDAGEDRYTDGAWVIVHEDLFRWRLDG